MNNSTNEIPIEIAFILLFYFIIFIFLFFI